MAVSNWLLVFQTTDFRAFQQSLRFFAFLAIARFFFLFIIILIIQAFANFFGSLERLYSWGLLSSSIGPHSRQLAPEIL